MAIFDPPRFKGVRILMPGVAAHPLRMGDPIFHTTIQPGFRTLRPGAFLTPFFYHGAHTGTGQDKKTYVLEYKIKRVPRLLNLDSLAAGKRTLWAALRQQPGFMKAASHFDPYDRRKLWNTSVAQVLALDRDTMPFDGWVSRVELMLLEPSKFLTFKKRHDKYIRRTGFKYEKAPSRFWETREAREALAGLRGRLLQRS